MPRSIPRWQRLARAIAAVAAFLAALAPLPAQAAFPGKNGRIAFTIAGDPVPGDLFTGRDIWTMEPDGSGLVQLTTHPRWDILPDWSADGQRIVFVSLRVGGFNIWTMRADGTGQTQLTFTDKDYGPTWSPDGTQIAFERDRSEGALAFTDLWVMNADGTSARRIEAAGDGVQSPAWSPDGTRIAYSNRVGLAPATIHTIKPDGTDRREVISHPSLSSLAPDWSPGGGRIAFHRSRTLFGGDWDVWSASAGGTDPQLLAEHATFPAFSPDGTRMSFKRFIFAEGTGVYVMNADGADEHRIALAADSSFESRADWGPVPEPRREDFKNGPAYCRALRDHLGEAEFNRRFGGGANALGKCVAGK